jgi:hypothetical protein
VVDVAAYSGRYRLNLKTAKAIGVDVASSLLLRADKVVK